MTFFKLGRFSVCTLAISLQMGCGGGGGSAGASAAGSVAQSSLAQSSVANNTDYSAVAGLYDASFTSSNIKDEAYLYIDTVGKITAYNYMGDSKDLGGNCYNVATLTNINSSITGKTLSFSAADNQFTVVSGVTTIAWVLDSTKKLTSINYGGALISSRVALKSGDTTIVVDSKKITTPTITDITSSICK